MIRTLRKEGGGVLVELNRIEECESLDLQEPLPIDILDYLHPLVTN